jgi:ABC-type proline/glycine betaine transport system ATPase subunit
VPGGQGVAVGERPTQTVNIIGYDIDEAVREGVKAGVLADGAASQRGAGRTGGRAMSYETP